jgi:DNA-directed RNA polymerase specialized sigma24 family protein
VRVATRAAFRMSHDPEVESIANFSAWKALQTYDGRIPEEAWVSFVTKRDVQYYWRSLKRRHEESTDPEAWESDVTASPYRETQLNIPQQDWQLLVEHFLLGYTLPALARRKGVGIPKVKLLLRAAISRFEEAVTKHE